MQKDRLVLKEHKVPKDKWDLPEKLAHGEHRVLRALKDKEVLKGILAHKEHKEPKGHKEVEVPKEIMVP